MGKLPYESKYPPTTASFHDLITDGTMPTGRSFSAFQTMHAGADSRDGDLGRGFHGAKAGDNDVIVNLPAMIAAVFEYFRCEM